MLHLFLEEARAQYDLETLWTCGPEFDQKPKPADDFTLELPGALSDPDQLFIELQKKFFQNKDPETTVSHLEFEGAASFQNDDSHVTDENDAGNLEADDNNENMPKYGNYLDKSEYVYESYDTRPVGRRQVNEDADKDDLSDIEKLMKTDEETSFESKVGFHDKVKG